MEGGDGSGIGQWDGIGEKGEMGDKEKGVDMGVGKGVDGMELGRKGRGRGRGEGGGRDEGGGRGGGGGGQVAGEPGAGHEGLKVDGYQKLLGKKVA